MPAIIKNAILSGTDKNQGLLTVGPKQYKNDNLFKPRVVQPTILSPTVAINKQARVRANQLYIPALSNTFLAVSEDQIIAFFN